MPQILFNKVTCSGMSLLRTFLPLCHRHFPIFSDPPLLKSVPKAGLRELRLIETREPSNNLPSIGPYSLPNPTTVSNGGTLPTPIAL